MPKILKDLAVVIGSYQKNGETKKKYRNIGVLMQADDGGQFLMIERSFNPAGVPFKEGSESILVSLYDPKSKDGATADPAPKQKANEDDIPF